MPEFPVDHLAPATPDNTRRPDVPVYVLVDAGAASASSGLSVFVSVGAPEGPAFDPTGPESRNLRSSRNRPYTPSGYG